jgi:hypothetical protein
MNDARLRVRALAPAAKEQPDQDRSVNIIVVQLGAADPSAVALGMGDRAASASIDSSRPVGPNV